MKVTTTKKIFEVTKNYFLYYYDNIGVYWNFDFNFNEIFERFKLIECQSGGKMLNSSYLACN